MRCHVWTIVFHYLWWFYWTSSSKFEVSEFICNKQWGNHMKQKLGCLNWLGPVFCRIVLQYPHQSKWKLLAKCVSVDAKKGAQHNHSWLCFSVVWEMSVENGFIFGALTVRQQCVNSFFRQHSNRTIKTHKYTDKSAD